MEPTEKIVHFIEAIKNIYRDKNKQAPIKQMKFDNDNLTEDFTAMVYALNIFFNEITEHTVYVIPKYNGKAYCGVQQDKVQMIGITSRGIHIKTRNNSSFNKTYILGKTVFLTKEQAEKALKGGAE